MLLHPPLLLKLKCSLSSSSSDHLFGPSKKKKISIFHFQSSRNLLVSAAATAPPPAREVDTFTKYSGYVFEQQGTSNSNSEDEALAFLDYNLIKISAIYRRKPFLLFRRLLQISTSLGRWFTFRYIDALRGQSDQMFKVRASELRKILVELGPAFVKIAQAVSSRPDVIPPAFLNELSLLQDRITPFSSDIAFNTIEKELGMAIDMLFSEISPEPVAAASLGQVYKARLRQSGQVVAVKVQRPGVQAAISLDIFILRILAGWVRKIVKFNTDLQAVVDEWASSLFRIDRLLALLVEEASQAERSGHHFPLTIVFVERKTRCDEVAEALVAQGLHAVALHGGRSQNEREAALRDFRNGSTNILVATDVASRGLDVTGVAHVVNLDLPKTMEDYVHRIGRTGRAGSTGQATSFYTDRDMFLVAQIRRAIADVESGNTVAFATGKVARKKEREAAAALRDTTNGISKLSMVIPTSISIEDKYRYMLATSNAKKEGAADDAWDD